MIARFSIDSYTQQNKWLSLDLLLLEEERILALRGVGRIQY